MGRSWSTWTDPNPPDQAVSGIPRIDPGRDRRTTHGDLARTRDLRRDRPKVVYPLPGALETALDRFDGIDRSSSSFSALMAAQQRLEDEDERNQFAREFLTVYLVDRVKGRPVRRFTDENNDRGLQEWPAEKVERERLDAERHEYRDGFREFFRELAARKEAT